MTTLKMLGVVSFRQELSRLAEHPEKPRVGRFLYVLVLVLDGSTSRASTLAMAFQVASMIFPSVLLDLLERTTD
jgi:hypothetical protein